MKKSPIISMIAAMSQNRVIGKDNSLPWRIPEDMNHFKTRTTGHAVIMGRKTYESMGRPLPNRYNIVISRSERYHTNEKYIVARSIEEAIEQANAKEATEIFIIGGAEIYKQSLLHADQIYLTIIHQEYNGDTFFPAFEETYPHIIFQEDHLDHAPPFSFITYSKTLN